MNLEDKIKSRNKQFIESEIPIEILKSNFLNDDYKEPEGKRIYRFHNRGRRFYLEVDHPAKELSYKTYVSHTTIIKSCSPTNQFLIKWYCDIGYDEAKKQMKITGAYGTLLHILFGELLSGNSVDIRELFLHDVIMQYIQDEKFTIFDIDISGWIDNIKQDIIGFIRWMNDYEVEPIGTELIYTSDEGHATAIDFVGFVKIKDDKIPVIVDFKSRRGGKFFDDHIVQLAGQRDIWNQNNTQQIEQVFNYGCKDYRFPIGKTVRPYNFKNQTNEKQLRLWKYYKDIFFSDEDNYKLKTHSHIKDEIVSRSTNTDEIFEDDNIIEKVIGTIKEAF